MELVQKLCDFTNGRAAEEKGTRPSYEDWIDVSVDEMYRFIALIMYMGFVKVPSIEHYWSLSPLYNGLWARAFMTRKRLVYIHGSFICCVSNYMYAIIKMT